MSIEAEKVMNLADGQVLYNDLRERVDDKYTKPSGGIPASDLDDDVFDNIVAVQDTEPQDESTRIWLPETQPEEVVVPTYTELTDLMNAITSLNNGKAPVIFDTAEGAIATFPDGADNLPMDIVVDIYPVQDLHGYDSTWPAGGGKNKLPEYTTQGQNGVTLTNNNGEITLTGTASANSFFDISLNLPAGNYRLSLFNPVAWQNSGEIICYIIRTNQSAAECQPTTVNNKQNISVTEGITSFRIRVSSGVSFGSGSFKLSPMLVSGTTFPTVFAPYSNICPISEWTGCNVSRTNINAWDGEWEEGDIDGTTGEPQTATTAWRTKNFIPVKPDTTYYVYGTEANKTIRARFYDVSKNYIGYFAQNNVTPYTGSSFKTPINAYYMKFSPNKSQISDHAVGVNYPSTDHDYHTGDTANLPISWQTEAGTVYGGSCTVNADGSVTVVAEWVSVMLGSLEWTKEISSPRFYSASLTELIKIPTTSAERISVIKSDTYLPSNDIFSNPSADSTDNMIAVYTNGQIYVADKTYYADGKDAFVTARGNVQIVYELATPVSYTLPSVTALHSLHGLNNVFADTGNVDMTYRADTKLWIEGHSETITVDSAMSGTSENPVQNKVIKTALDGKEPIHSTITISGSTPSITAVAGNRYICGEVSTLTIVVPSTGIIDVTFESGSTATVLTVTPPTGMTMKWANGFDPTTLEANTTYEINIMDGHLGVAGSWS